LLRALHDSLKTAGAEVRADHVVYEELEALVDDRLAPAEREIVSAHLLACELCAEEAADLRQFRAALAAEGASQRTGVQRPTALGTFAAFFKSPMIRFGAAVAAVAVLVTAYTISDRRAAPPATPTSMATTAPPVPPANAPLLTLQDADRQITIDASGHLASVTNISEESVRAVENALRDRRVQIPSYPALQSNPGALLGSAAGDSEFGPTSPLGVVREIRPRFEWRARPRATGYRVLVVDADLRPVLESPIVTAHEWTAAKDLERARMYTWQVTAMGEGLPVTAPRPPAAEARFRIVDARTDSALSEAERAGVKSHLVLGVLYAEAGLLDEAQRELTAFARLNPQSEIAADLLRSVSARRDQLAAPTATKPAQ
jgi:anti-sigma factor RsiW